MKQYKIFWKNWITVGWVSLDVSDYPVDVVELVWLTEPHCYIEEVIP